MGRSRAWRRLPGLNLAAEAGVGAAPLQRKAGRVWRGGSRRETPRPTHPTRPGSRSATAASPGWAPARRRRAWWQRPGAQLQRPVRGGGPAPAARRSFSRPGPARRFRLRPHFRGQAPPPAHSSGAGLRIATSPLVDGGKCAPRGPPSLASLGCFSFLRPPRILQNKSRDLLQKRGLA